MLTEAIGWTAALLLLVTMIRQVWSQWVSGAVGGVSRWLFIGQVAASAGFTVYSVLLDNVVFALTNGLLTINAITGLLIDRRNRRHQAERKAQASDSAPDALRGTTTTL
ncbi:uncharacterized protein with PQ loop repeat [Panacagrimonas perspica]|uniref:Uncharacterized protein with PQ loop repeat n=1 Tax=Panacagrimonas perspica TaxID=381431 RepID=A0A4R7P3F3_9GAMM|nr:hypothetical protein [Panacagrimonas perspica]TDU28285.1 uncharacterized protein with PQ loop repeat [Panacagrimonas perspica]THD04321.1 hypothetical protein B1810_06045 [Panacagrimonas perspica]